MTYPVSNKLSAQQKKKCYKKKLSYKKVWEKVYPWVQCEDHEVGMFCTLCKNGKATTKCRRWVDDKGIVDWNHATELLKQHSGSKWHLDSPITARMVKHVDQLNVIEMQCAGAAKQLEEQKKKES